MTNKYSHPRWKERRREILNRDGLECQSCTAKDCELHAHHLYYITGRAIWDYPDCALITLCKACHTEWHKTIRKFTPDFEGILNNIPHRNLDAAHDLMKETAKTNSLTGMPINSIIGTLLHVLLQIQENHRN